MNADQILAAQSPTAGWETESRAFRAAGSADLPPRWADFRDPMDALGARFRQRMDQARREAADPRFTRDEHRAMEVLGLEGKRSEEHTSELQSLMRISYAVFCLKKKKITDSQRA